MAQALARWRHPVAPSEALDVLYRAMRPVLYHRIRMAIETPAIRLHFVVVTDSLLRTNIAK
jgi:hypothetical protein